jgi:NAD(P)-dependent dehydrogenase (short-subunit alcohol dehydrogenase family)
MNHKICVVTGATSGVGLATAMLLAAKGDQLVLVGRNKERGQAAIANVNACAKDATARFYKADLSRLAEVNRVAVELRTSLPKIDVLINNAGAIYSRRDVTEEGLERTFALNHLAYFSLTLLLHDLLTASAQARVINVASEAHRWAELDFEDLQSSVSYSARKAYNRSKLCNVLYTRELARRLEGTSITANCLHPGFVASRFGDNNHDLFGFAFSIAKHLAGIPPKQAAATIVYLASSPDVRHQSGLYFINCSPTNPSRRAQDRSTAERLWHESRRLMGYAERREEEPRDDQSKDGLDTPCEVKTD